MTWLFSTEGFPARWHCGEWPAWLGWAHIVFDSLTAIAYFLTFLGLLAWRLQQPIEERFRIAWMLVAGFFLLCGLTHVVFAIQFWLPVYYLDGILLKPIQAVIAFAAIVGIFKERKRWRDPIQIIEMATLNLNRHIEKLSQGDGS